MRTVLFAVLGAVLVLTAPASADFGILSLTNVNVVPMANVVDPPHLWVPGMTESNTHYTLFMSRYYLDAPVVLPSLIPGSYDDHDMSLYGPPRTFPVGYYNLGVMSLDPVGTAGGVQPHGSVTFAVPILFIDYQPELRDVLYGGLESGDWFTLSPGLTTLDLDWWAGPHVDQFFVVTAAVPEPGSVALLVTTLFGAALCRSLRRRRG